MGPDAAQRRCRHWGLGCPTHAYRPPRARPPGWGSYAPMDYSRLLENTEYDDLVGYHVKGVLLYNVWSRLGEIVGRYNSS